MHRIVCPLALAALLGLSGLAEVGEAQIVESIEAKVNGEIVFASELDAAMALNLLLDSRRPIESVTEEEYNRLRFSALLKRCKNILLSQECQSILDKRGYDKRLNEREINRAAENMVTRYRARFDSDEAMQEDMKKRGMTDESLRSQSLQLSREQYWERMARQLVRERVSPVTEAEVERFKAAHPDDWEKYDRIRLSHILLRVPDGTSKEQEDEIRKKAETVALRVRGGEDFATLARELSQHTETREKGGDFGVLRRGETLPEFDPLFDLPAGGISNPIRTALGYHVVLIRDRTAISDYLYDQNVREALSDWIREIVDRPETEILCKGEFVQDMLADSVGQAETLDVETP